MNKYYHKHKNMWNNPQEIHKRVLRNKARRILIKKLGYRALYRRDVDHIRPLHLGGKTVLSNLRPLSIRRNRGRK